MAYIQSTKDSELSDEELEALLHFKPSFDKARMEELECNSAAKGIGRLRRVTLLVLTIDAVQLSEVSVKDAKTYGRMVGFVNTFKEHAEALLALADSAKARLFVADAREIPADPA